MKTQPIRNTPEQAHAIRLLMDRIKRAQKSVIRRYPTFVPGVTTTAQYIALFDIQGDAHVLPYGRDLQKWHRPAPYLTGPEVVDESEQLDLLELA